MLLGHVESEYHSILLHERQSIAQRFQRVRDERRLILRCLQKAPGRLDPTNRRYRAPRRQHLWAAQDEKTPMRPPVDAQQDQPLQGVLNDATPAVVIGLGLSQPR